ncbi:cation channel family protein, putative (macronuclear) [Tetrahymena thermophila SB210]|uniref:Cation channel family protein, putative n=1 Tax=Tetrahymena thermophila (strain SB210) TaxID=312017 RepID=X1W3Q8_TETTS|nr:cation channel family protein, putative [Tetrahymena thermophila SB210]EAR83839.3 cation channel family protein, putative [Tetrahymena thermophila SB210]|eukprot:XP_001031502.3 cation channel family protein, putative [Tetrahymena thermophila SB210]
MSFSFYDEQYGESTQNRIQKSQKIQVGRCIQNYDNSILYGISSINKANKEYDHIIDNDKEKDGNLMKKQDDLRLGEKKRQQWLLDIIPSKVYSSSKLELSNIQYESCLDKKLDQSLDESRIIEQIQEGTPETFTNTYTVQDQTHFIQRQQMNQSFQTENQDILSLNSQFSGMRKPTFKNSAKMSQFQNNQTLKKKQSYRQKFGSQNQEEDKDQERKSELKIRNKRTSHEVWLQGFFIILIFVNRFIFKSKKKLIFFKPQMLKQNQLQAINDIASSYKSKKEDQAKQEKIFPRSRWIFRKMRIQYLIFRKKMKKCIIPINQCLQKLKSFIIKLLHPIPVILPFYKISLIWDLISILFIQINSFIIPFEIAFLNGDTFDENLKIVSMIIFFINFFMVLNTAYYENGILQKNRINILINFTNKHLIIEFLAFICLYYNPFGIALLRILFLIKFFQFYETVQNLIESLQLSDKYYFLIHLVTLLFEIIFLCHIFACTWYGIGQFQLNQNMFPNWIDSYGINNLVIGSRYVQSVYFAIVTVGTIGYGDINPKSDIEKIFISTMTLLSCGVFAYIISNIQDVYRDYNKKKERFLVNLTELNKYMFTRDVNPNLQQMARKYLEYVHKQDFKRGEVPNQTLNSLSKFLREEICEEIFSRSLGNIQIFQKFSPQIQKALASKMKETIYGPDEMILKKGQFSTPALYYIFKGKVEVTIEQGNKICQDFNNLTQQQSFFQLNEKSTFGQAEFFSQSHETSLNVKSLNITTVHILYLNDFQETIKHYVNDKEIYQELKDKLNNYQDYSSSGIFCYSCKSSDHVISDCPIFFYKPNKQRVVNQYLKVYDQAKKQIERSCQRFSLNALAFQYDIEEDCKYFREINFNQHESDIADSVNQSQDTQNQIQYNYSNSQRLIYNQQKSDIDKNQKVTFFEVDQHDKHNDINSEKQKEINKARSELDWNNYHQNQNADNVYCSSNYNLDAPKIVIETIQNSQILPQIQQNQQLNESQIQQPQQSQQNQQSSQMYLQVRSQREEFIKRVSLRNTRCKNNLAIEKKIDEKQIDGKKLSIIHLKEGLQLTNNSKNSLAIDMIKKVLDQMQKINSKKALKLQGCEIDDFIAESVKNFKFYMTHNNIVQVIQSYNKYYSLKSKKKRRITIYQQ